MRPLRNNLTGGRFLPLVVILALTIASLPLLAPAPAVAGGGQTFKVTNTDNDDDNDCDTDCSLREAIGASNDTPGVLDKIAFNIPGAGPHAIVVNNVAVDDAVIIDGYTQPGAKKNTLTKGTNAKIKIEFTGSDGTLGLAVNDGPTTIRGIKFQGHDTCLQLNATADNNVIEGNEFGDDDPIQGCTFFGIEIKGGSVGNRIGGGKPAQRNFIVNSGGDEDVIDGAAVKVLSNDNTIINNLFGTNKNGNGCQPNRSAVEISGNNNLTTKNRFCIDFAGAAVVVNNGNGNKISRNSIFLVDQFGTVTGIIRVGGANNGQAAPVLDSAKTTGTTTKIKGTLTSTPDTDFVIEFFSSAPDDADGDPLFNDAIADKFIGKQKVTTNGAGVATFTFVPKKKVPAGRLITATATDPDGNTSALSNNEAVT